MASSCIWSGSGYFKTQWSLVLSYKQRCRDLSQNNCGNSQGICRQSWLIVLPCWVWLLSCTTAGHEQLATGSRSSATETEALKCWSWPWPQINIKALSAHGSSAPTYEHMELRLITGQYLCFFFHLKITPWFLCTPRLPGKSCHVMDLDCVILKIIILDQLHRKLMCYEK